MTAEILSKKLEKMIGDDGLKVPGLGVIVFKDGTEIFSKFIGRRKLNPPKPVTRRTRFRAASLSKMFTVFSLMQLVEKGKLNLDDDASDYLGFELRNPNHPRKKITARMLASHTSSLRDGKIYSTPPDVSLREFFQPDGKFWEGGSHFGSEEPRKFFSYCNLNYGVLGTIIEVVSGKRFDVFQRESILMQLATKADYVPANLAAEEFEQLGAIYRKKNPAGVWNEFGEWFAQMDDFKAQPVADTLALQNPYDEKFCYDFKLSDYRVGTNATIFSPQGGLRISFDELACTLEMMMNGGTFRGRKILSDDSFAEMCTPQWIYDGTNGDTCGGVMLSYGLGVYFIDGKSRARVCKNFAVNLVGHTGAAFGLLSGVFFIPNMRSGFIYMMNGEAVTEDIDSRSRGRFSDNYIWEEKIMDVLCSFLCAENNFGR